MRRIAAVTVAFVVLRLLTAALLSDPGYTDAYYFTDVATRLARGLGLTADFLWSPVEAQGLASLALPVVSHVFWVPLPTALGAVGITLLGPFLGTFRAAQSPFIVLAALIPVATYVAARSLGAAERSSLVAAIVAGLGGVLAPFLVAVDALAPAALLGTAFFIAYARAAAGSVRAGVTAGLLVGLLYLSRSEGALFGLALVALLLSSRARAAGAAGALVALAIGGAWFARDLATGASGDLFARAALLVRYEDFFAFAPAYFNGQPEFLTAKLAALVTNALTFLFAFGLIPVIALAGAVRSMWSRPDVRAWSALALLVFLAQSLVWTLHSTRGSYLHSLAAFFPFGLACAAAGAERLLSSRGRDIAIAWTWGTVLIVALLSVGAVFEVDSDLADAARERGAAVAAIPDGPFLAIDAAAWRWITDRAVAVTPSDGENAARCVASRIGAKSIVLEAAHFSRYDALYSGSERWSWLGDPVVRGTIKVYPVSSASCG